jgi:hypothetical protein
MIDTSSSETWAAEWLAKAAAQIADPAEAYRTRDGQIDRFSLACDLWADLPWANPQLGEVMAIVAADPRWPAVNAFGEEADRTR